MRLRKYVLYFAILGMISACGHGYEGEYRSTTESSNEFLNALTGSIADQKYIIGSDFVESNGQRKLLDKIYVRKTGGKEFLVFKDSESEEIWNIVDANTLRLESGPMSITLTRIESDQDQVQIQDQDDKEWIVGNWEIDVEETEEHFKKPGLTYDVEFQKAVPHFAKGWTLEITNEAIFFKIAGENDNLHLRYTTHKDPFRLVVSNYLDFDPTFSELTFTRDGSYLIQKMVQKFGDKKDIETEYLLYWRNK